MTIQDGVDIDLGDRTIVVTGVAGFIGHHTASLLLDWGCRVIGIDCFTDYYSRDLKERNLDLLRGRRGFSFVEASLDRSSCAAFADADAVVHLAAQPGVRESWADFEVYVQQNIHVTKIVLDQAVEHGVGRVVYASSSSVYGQAPAYPTTEDAPTEPRSPYGITKLAGERLAVAYAHELGLSTVSLRYFTVFGPRQRPDMAIQRLIESALGAGTFTLFGDGTQVRDFTFVQDVARANALAALRPQIAPGSVFNVCGEDQVTLGAIIDAVEGATGAKVKLERSATSLGDVVRTGGSSAAIRAELGWRAEVPVIEGIRRQVEAIAAAFAA